MGHHAMPQLTRVKTGYATAVGYPFTNARKGKRMVMALLFNQLWFCQGKKGPPRHDGNRPGQFLTPRVSPPALFSNDAQTDCPDHGSGGARRGPSGVGSRRTPRGGTEEESEEEVDENGG